MPMWHMKFIRFSAAHGRKVNIQADRSLFALEENQPLFSNGRSDVQPVSNMPFGTLSLHRGD